jgi:hypothetical protein
MLKQPRNRRANGSSAL